MEAFSLEQIRSAFRHTIPRLTLHTEGYTRASVLVPIFVDRGIELLFTKRTETVEKHKGQISFPGGVADDADAEAVATAVREAEEEIGLHQSCIEIIGMLDDMIVPTGFLITPVVGVICSPPPLVVNSGEVAEVFRAPLEFFANEKNGRREAMMFRGKAREVWFYEFQGHTIWGATALIIRSLFARISAPHIANATSVGTNDSLTS
ncbi:MAG: CoA pyrophosphatase [Ignavibacteriae bacterium]|nr:CoA pyrophosphatase [Ignavibacteriota bacterium]